MLVNTLVFLVTNTLHDELYLFSLSVRLLFNTMFVQRIALRASSCFYYNVLHRCWCCLFINVILLLGVFRLLGSLKENKL